jgi:hypothetical protein
LGTLPGNNSKTKLASTDELIAACVDTELKVRLAKRLDPDGMHVCTKHFYHDDTQSIRGIWLTKITGFDLPQLSAVDMNVEEFNKFRYFEDLHKQT